MALLPLRAADADTERKLREALEQKLNELQTHPQSATPKPAAAAPQPKTAVAPPAAPAPVTVPAASPAPTPAVVAPTPADSEAIAKAREALRQKMAELDRPAGGRPTPPAQWNPPPVAQPKVEAPKAQPPPPAAKPAPAPAPAPATAAAKPKPAEKPVAAKSQEKASKPQVKPQAEKVSNKPAAPAVAKTLAPIQAPPSSLPAEKQQRLSDLLKKYRAEEITPEEYHQQRAKILSEP